MLIDWFTVGAQVVNFIVLVWLMKRFLYQPILDAIEKRRQEIARALAEAEADKERARSEREEFRRRNEDFELRRAELLEEARAEAGRERGRLMEEARSDAEEQRARRREALRQEHERLEGEIVRRVREEVLAIAGKALGDLAGSSLEERVAEVFCRRLRELDAGTREKLAKALDASRGPVVVRSAFELTATAREALRAALNETLPAEVSFRTEPDMIGGFEILFGEQKLAWNVESHLEGLRGRMGEILSERDGGCAPERPEAAS